MTPSLAARIAPSDRTIPAMLTRQAPVHAQASLVTVGSTTWRFEEIVGVASRAAGALAQAGIVAGDRVAMLCGNRAEFLQWFLGITWLGAIAVPLNVAARGASLQHMLANSGARLLIIEGDRLEALARIEPHAVALERLWLIDWPSTPEPRWEAVPAPALGDALAPAAARPGDTAAILYTSGTTGPSKGVCCPHAQFFWWAAHTARWLGVREGDVLYTPLPLFHTNALNTFFQALLHGAHEVIDARFSASNFVERLHVSGATVTYLLGAMAPMLLAQAPSPRDGTHRVRVSLAPGVPARFHSEFERRFGFTLLDGYGSTETNHVIGALAADRRLGTMGKVAAGFAARVVDADDNEVPPDVAGELVLRADEPFAFATGYFANAQATVEAWRNLWFHTGDRVVRDADGFIRFVDRMKDAIRRRGENISAFEVEQVLLAHAAIAAAAAFAVRSSLGEDEVMCTVVLHAGASLEPAALLDHCQPLLPYFAVPRYVEIAAALPLTENGKVQKFRLRERGVSATTWDREAAGYRLRR